MSRFQQSVFRGNSFISHLLSSKSRYSIHSPFVYKFVTEVLPHKEEPVYQKIHELRKKLAQSTDLIKWEEIGAGSHHFPDSTAIVSDLARLVSRRHKEGALLYRICQYYQPQNCLELGTHLGISSAYQALGLKEGKLTTVEGVAAFAEMAEGNLDEVGVPVEVRKGKFQDVLGQLVEEKEAFDYAFIDGHHTYKATKAYFHMLIPMLKDGAILVFDDIYWSEGMKRAWEEIRADSEVSLSLDLFFFGLCFIRRPQAKEHFHLRFF